MFNLKKVPGNRIGEITVSLLKYWTAYLVGVKLITLVMDEPFTAINSLGCLIAASIFVLYEEYKRVKEMNAYDVLAGRVVGEIPLSIGTALAIEALENNQKYGSLWINLRTLYRNIYESVDKEYKQYLTSKAIVDTMQEELFYLADHCKDRIDHIQVYHREYGDLIHRFPKALLRTPHTPLQKQYDSTMNAVIDEVLLRDKEKTIDFSRGSKLQGEPVNSLIITHYPVDLLSRTAFTKLRLLESYTGTIKSKSQWNSKLTEGKLLKNIPFNNFTVQVFGDNGVLFNRYPKKVRVAILEIAEKYKWTSMTTTDKIRQNLNWMSDRYTAELLRGFF